MVAENGAKGAGVIRLIQGEFVTITGRPAQPVPPGLAEIILAIAFPFQA